MLQNIKPRPKFAKKKEGTLTATEKSFAKGLLAQGYQAQDVTFIVNQGRLTTINQGRVSPITEDATVIAASADEVKKFLRVQASYDSKTLLNPYKDERLIRAREAMMAAVQIFNSPMLVFKAELFSVLANIAWTYLLHEKMEQTKKGSSQQDNGDSITLNGTLGKLICPIKDVAVKESVKKIIEIRDAVEHTFFVGGAECFGALFQSCCINFERHMTEWFGQNLSLARELSLALQFVRLNKDQIVAVEKSDFPAKIKAIYKEIQESEFSSHDAFQLTVHYTAESSSKTNADLHKLINYDEGNIHSTVAIKKVDYKRLGQADIVKKIKTLKYPKFGNQNHQDFWKAKWPTANTRNKNASAYGEIIFKNQWVWYEQTWLPEILKHCEAAGDKFK